jgi:hypothetical protein
MLLIGKHVKVSELSPMSILTLVFSPTTAKHGLADIIHQSFAAARLTR